MKFRLSNISVLLHLFNPVLVILGGSVARSGSYLVDAIIHSLNKFAIARLKDDTRILTSELGDNANVLGAVGLVLNNVFESNKNYLLI